MNSLGPYLFALPDGRVDADGARTLSATAERIHRDRAALGIDAGVIRLAADLLAAKGPFSPEITDDLFIILTGTLVAARRGHLLLDMSAIATSDPFGITVAAALAESADDRPDAGRIRDAAERVRRAAAHPEARALIGKSIEDGTPLVLQDPFIRRKKDDRLEKRLAKAIRARIGPLGQAAAEASPLDRAKAGLSSPGLFIITGGPGTGKTTLIAQALSSPDTLRARRVHLAAPTGKAAQRLGEALRAVRMSGDLHPTTIHRMLEYSPGEDRFRRNAQAPLDADLVVIDEASMIDAALLDAVLSALEPGTTICLVGDADQLPSVDTGAVFGDLVHALNGSPRVLSLTVNHRLPSADAAEKAVGLLADAVRRGDLERVRAIVRERTSAVPAAAGAPRGLILLAHGTDESVRPVITRWIERRLSEEKETGIYREADFDRAIGEPDSPEGKALDLLLRRSGAARILVAAHVGTRGTERINAMTLESRRSRAPLGAAGALPPLTPVMVESNDYRRGLFNGDVGIVLHVRGARTGSRVQVVFRRADGFLVATLSAIAHRIRIADACTVHKCQGSEMDDGLLLLPERDLPIWTRELVYTAITRVRRSLTIVGDPAMLTLAAERGHGRRSRLCERIKEDAD